MSTEKDKNSFENVSSKFEEQWILAMEYLENEKSSDRDNFIVLDKYLYLYTN